MPTLTTYPISGSLPDALNGGNAAGVVEFRPANTTNALFDANDVRLGGFDWTIQDITVPPVPEGDWVVSWRSLADPAEAEWFPPASTTLSLPTDAPLSWAQIIGGATSDLPLTPSLVTEAQTARDEAVAANTAAQAVGTTNDTVIAGRVGDTASATSAALNSIYARPRLMRGTGIDPSGAADSQSAIQAKLIEAASAGARAVFSEGTYRLNSRLDFPSNSDVDAVGTAVLNFTQTGTGGNVIQNSDYAGAAGGNRNIRIRNLTIRGSGDGTPSGSGSVASGIIFRHCTDVEISGCRLERIQGVSVGWQGVARGRFVNNTVYEGGRGGFVAWGHGSLVRTEDIVCADNMFYKLGDDAMAAQGNTPSASAGSQPRRFTFTGNTVYGQSAVYANGAGRGLIIMGVSDVTVANNTMTDTYSSGVLIQSDTEGGVWLAENINVSGNVIRDAGFAGGSQPKSGVYVTKARQVTIDGNTISESVENGVLLTADVVGFSITDNVLRDNGATSAYSGINLSGTSTLDISQGVVSGNVVTGSGGHGIRNRYGDHVDVLDNIVLDNGDDTTGAVAARAGILVDTTGSCGVSNNRCTDTRSTGKTQTYGVRVAQAAASVRLLGNYLLGNSTGPLNLGADPAVLIKRGNLESTTASGNYDVDVSGVRRYSHTATPEGVIAAPVGSVCEVTDGAIWTKLTGTGATGWVKLSTAPGPLYGEVATDQSVTNSTTLTNATGAAVAVEANATYELVAYVDYSATTTADLLLGWTWPTGTTMSWTIDGLQSAAASSTTTILRARFAQGSTGTAGGIGAGTRVVCRPIGKVKTGSTAGTLQLQFAQAAADAAGATVIYADASYIKLTRIA